MKMNKMTVKMMTVNKMEVVLVIGVKTKNALLMIIGDILESVLNMVVVVMKFILKMMILYGICEILEMMLECCCIDVLWL